MGMDGGSPRKVRMSSLRSGSVLYSGGVHLVPSPRSLSSTSLGLAPAFPSPVKTGGQHTSYNQQAPEEDKRNTSLRLRSPDLAAVKTLATDGGAEGHPQGNGKSLRGHGTIMAMTPPARGGPSD